MTAINIMLDLETWGKIPGSDLRSIGACVFAPVTRHGGSLVHDGSLGTIKPFYVATDNPIASHEQWQERVGNPAYFDETTHEYHVWPLKRDPETVQWWNDQSAEAQAAFADPVDLKEALYQFRDWLRQMTGDINPTPALRLWSHGPAFDPPILAAAYRAVGLPVPWHYRAPRDTRTLFDDAGIDDEGGSYRTFMSTYNTGTMHHALDDAVAQARAVCAARQRLSAPKEALRLAVEHIEHMSDWIAKQNAGYSFDSIGEDMWQIQAAMD